MKRRRFIQALAAAPAAPALFAQQAGPSVEAPEPDIVFAIPDDASEPVLRFFNRSQFATLQRLSDVLMPGALEAQTPEFMDFLIGDSPVERQQIWLTGLAALESQSQTQFSKAFSDIDAAQAETLLAPLRQAWTYEPADPVAGFLIAAKQDIRTATINSPARNPVPSAGTRRRGGGGLYWLPVE